MMAGSKPTETELLLPFWANETLSDAERAEMDRALAEDPDLRVQADVLRRMRATMQQDASADTGPGPFGLARLHRAIEAENPAPQSRNRVRSALWLVGSALAASLATIAVIGSQTGPEPVYEQASGEAAGVVVTFAPEASIAEIADLVRTRGLTIVDGPSALGLFRLTPLPGEEVSLDMLAETLSEDERVLRVDIEE